MVKLFRDNTWRLLIVHYFRKKCSIIDVWQTPKYAPGYLTYKYITCIPRWNDVEKVVSTSFQCGIHVVCLQGYTSFYGL